MIEYTSPMEQSAHEMYLDSLADWLSLQPDCVPPIEGVPDNLWVRQAYFYATFKETEAFEFLIENAELPIVPLWVLCELLLYEYSQLILTRSALAQKRFFVKKKLNKLHVTEIDYATRFFWYTKEVITDCIFPYKLLN